MEIIALVMAFLVGAAILYANWLMYKQEKCLFNDQIKQSRERRDILNKGKSDG